MRYLVREVAIATAVGVGGAFAAVTVAIASAGVMFAATSTETHPAPGVTVYSSPWGGTVASCDTDEQCTQWAAQQEQFTPSPGFLRVADQAITGEANRHDADEAYCDSAAEHNYVTGIIDPVAERRCAALAIEDRLQAGGQVLEDWTWPGAPAIVTEHNDELIAEYQANVAAAPDAADVDEFLGWIADGGRLV